MSKFQEVKKLLQRDELKIALNLILKITTELGYNEYHSEVTSYSARYSGNESSYNKGLIDNKEYARKRNIITIRLNDFLDKIEENLKDSFYQRIIFEKSQYSSYEDFKNKYLDEGSKSSKSDEKAKILFLSANPTNTGRLQVDKEYSLIKKELARNKYYDLLNAELALTVENLIKAMNQRPQIVHFAGHGKRNAIIISDDNNKELEMPTRALKRLFRQHKEGLKLVVLNACYSAKQAKALSELGFYVIGMNNAAIDSGSITFASGLYIGLSEGKSVEKAFDDTMVVIETKHPNFANLPEVWKDGEQLDL